MEKLNIEKLSKEFAEDLCPQGVEESELEEKMRKNLSKIFQEDSYKVLDWLFKKYEVTLIKKK